MAREAEHSDVLRAIDAQKAGREPIDTQQADSKAKAKDIDIGRKPIDPQQPNSKDTETDSKSKAKAKVIDIGIDIENKDTADAGPSRNANAPKKKDKRVREEAPQVNYHFSSAPRLSRDERKLQVLVGTIERLEKHSTRPRKRPRLQPSPTPQLLYTVQLRSGSFVVDLQVRLLLGMSNDAPNPLFRAYPQLRRQKLTVPQKERLWGPLSMAASGEQAGADAKLASVLGAHDRMQFVGMPLYFVSADEVVNVICRDFPQIGKHLVTVALDLGSPAKVSRPWTGPQPMMPLKYALKLHFAEK
ncbi:hypothetical protein GGF43_006244 [Coemansia sp. RSA 2618]|nr:hypothetical protein GGF43_006244 [Coemansia sp. RSA 2618]